MATLTIGPFGPVRRLVLKFGSALIADPAAGRPRTEWMAGLAADVARLKAGGTEVLIVSSGAVALGRGALGLGRGRLKLEEKQAAAAAGQARLMAAWADAFAPHAIPVAQALLTPDDTERRRRWLNARATLETLLVHGAVPVVNENDTVATDELRYGDNDRLAARVAEMAGADLMILFSDVDGLYARDPRRDPGAPHVGEIRTIDARIEAMAGGINQAAGTGSGGMRTKIEAARIAMAAGCAAAIADGSEAGSLGALVAGGVRASWFWPLADRESARRAFIANALNTAGAYLADSGAAAALANGASLLPVGVVAVDGAFERGDTVEVRGPDGRVLGLGISAYSAADAARILGRRSDETEAILGFAGRPALIHRDDLVLTPPA